ncbi:uncharacterized protein M421DRAFT_90864 [Didymella exigua CBS 183.55]|uniref:Uncharacterized protein n=1 Tax=Didymella exigua CBS 183.55 TaxID=1150837 RepID=A0A6A5RVI8_9PLEO|nr:uncharacterized protein M421DRAFT_90864 [Didymella exigua CBS 183.55]KAF1930296.1 hypothetical protein M421DRAFT_90864 [Didymella exigua CBS 183.55]
MRNSFIISSSLLAIAVSGAPLVLPRTIITDPAPTKTSNPLGTAHAARDLELPVVNGLVEDIKIPNIATLPTLPKLPVGNVNLPVRRNVNVNVPIAVTVDDLVDIRDVDVPQPTIAFVAPALPALLKAARDIKQSLPVVGGADVPLDVGSIRVGTVDKYADNLVSGVKVESLPARDIKQSLPVVGGADVPLDVGNIQVGTVDKYADELVDGTKVESLPVRDITQSLPVVGGADVPLDAGKIQVGTVDQYVDQLAKGTKIESLPKVARDISQSLPVVAIPI